MRLVTLHGQLLLGSCVFIRDGLETFEPSQENRHHDDVKCERGGGEGRWDPRKGCIAGCTRAAAGTYEVANCTQLGR